MSTVAPGEPNLAAIGADVAQAAVRLVRAEINLARAELQTALKRLIVAAILLGIALVLLLLGVIEALGTLPAAFSVQLFGNGWLGWLALGGVFLLLALIVGFIGTRRLRGALREGKQTAATLKEDTEWVKHLTKRAGSGS